MCTNSALAQAEQQLVATLSVPAPGDAPEQPELRALSWPAFLTLLERYCRLREWSLEYQDVSDYSCAIFAWEDPLPTVHDEERRETPEQSSSLWQRPSLL